MPACNCNNPMPAVPLLLVLTFCIIVCHVLPHDHSQNIAFWDSANPGVPSLVYGFSSSRQFGGGGGGGGSCCPWLPHWTGWSSYLYTFIPTMPPPCGSSPAFPALLCNAYLMYLDMQCHMHLVWFHSMSAYPSYQGPCGFGVLQWCLSYIWGGIVLVLGGGVCLPSLPSCETTDLPKPNPHPPRFGWGSMPSTTFAAECYYYLWVVVLPRPYQTAQPPGS